MFSNTSRGRRLGICGIDQAQQKTGIRKSDGVTSQRRSRTARYDIRKRRLRIAEDISPVERAGVQVVVALKAPLSAEFIRVVVGDPREAGNRRVLLENIGNRTCR